MNFYCDICCMNFKSKRNYGIHTQSSRHLSRFNNDTKTKLHTCTCGKTFTQSSNLSRHRKNCVIHNTPIINPTHAETETNESKMNDRQINE